MVLKYAEIFCILKKIKLCKKPIKMGYFSINVPIYFLIYIFNVRTI